MRTSLSFSVIVPVRDEAGNIGPLIEEIRSAMAGTAPAGKFEIIYVDDGSRDATADELSAAVRDVPELRVLRHQTSAGQSQAMLTGARAAGGEWLITLDGDGQNDPADIPKLVAARDAALSNEAEAADFLYIGHRRRREDSLARRYQSWLANDIRGWVLGDHTPDAGCGLRLIRRDVLLTMPGFDALHRFLPALIRLNGGRTISVEITHRPRLRGVSKYGLWKRLWLGAVDMLGVLWLLNRTTRIGPAEITSQAGTHSNKDDS